MKASFKVEKLNFISIQELPYSWNNQNYLDLLELMDFEDTSDLTPEELKDFCLMSLADQEEPKDAAKIVLEYVFKNKLTKGQIDNLSNEIIDEKMWEEYADISTHEDFFNVNQLLYSAYNGTFPNPKAVKFQVKVTSNSIDGLSVFNDFPEAALIRLLTRGMSDKTLIYRLFEEQIEGFEFKDARDIIWQLTFEKNDEREIIFNVISSLYWFQDLKYVTDFEGSTHADKI